MSRSRAQLLLLLTVASCTTAKGRAEAALAAADRAVASLPATAAHIAPDQLGALDAALAEGRDALTKGDYAAASARLSEVPVLAQELSDSLPARTARLSALLDTLAVAMPRNLAAIKATLDTIAMRKRLPRGLDQQELQEAKDSYAAASTEWPEVMSQFHAGELASAASRALNLKTRISRSLLALGLVSDERAWSNITLPPR